MSETAHTTEEKISWGALQEMMDAGTVLTVKVSGVVNAGVIAYVEGRRGFIPASQITNGYVEDLNDWLDKEVDVKIITVDEEKRRLVLSGRVVAQEKAAAEQQAMIDAIQVGEVFDGTVEKLTTYGAFIRLENGLSGLVHISQISTKRIKTPNEVLKTGDSVKVKVINKKDGKLSLSMKALQSGETHERAPRENFKFKSEGEASTALGSLLAGIKLDEQSHTKCLFTARTVNRHFLCPVDDADTHLPSCLIQDLLDEQAVLQLPVMSRPVTGNDHIRESFQFIIKPFFFFIQ